MTSYTELVNESMVPAPALCAVQLVGASCEQAGSSAYRAYKRLLRSMSNQEPCVMIEHDRLNPVFLLRCSCRLSGFHAMIINEGVALQATGVCQIARAQVGVVDVKRLR